MWRAGRHMKRDIEGRLEASSVKVGARGVLGRLRLHAADDHARRHGDGAADERAALHRCSRRRSSPAPSAGTLVAGVRRLALVALRPPRQPRALLPGHRGVPAVFVVQLLIYGFHELTEAQHLPEQRAAARRDRAVRPRRHLRPVPDLPARAAAAGVARGLEPVPSRRLRVAAFAGRLTRRRFSGDAAAPRTGPELRQSPRRARIAHGRRVPASPRPSSN